jgi:hypothetical protein
MKIQIPEYITIKHYNQFKYLEDIDSASDKVLYKISTLTNVSIEELETWPITAIKQVYAEVDKILENLNPEFYPVITWQGKEYGYRAVQKMSMAEYVDLSELCKNPTQNLTNILAILYRPITENKTKSSKYIYRSTIKALQYEVENVFNYYDVEKYDAATRKQIADEYLEFPAEIGLGALNFFMLVGLSSSKNTTSYFPSMKEMIQKMKKSKLKSVLLSTMAGYTFSTKFLKPKSYKSQETKQ